MQRKRRSGRIAKKLPIVLLGTDATGKVFFEETIAVVLSRHGAGVVTRYRFSPDERLTLRLPGSAKEAEIRLVGQIGGEPGRYVYGVTFVDPHPDFWPMEFPPPDPFEPATQRIALECSMCQTRAEMEQGDIEEDVYSATGNILRHCAECGTSTPWKKAEGETPPLSPRAQPNQISTCLQSHPHRKHRRPFQFRPRWKSLLRSCFPLQVRLSRLRRRTPLPPPFPNLLPCQRSKSLPQRPPPLLCCRCPRQLPHRLPQKLRVPRLSSRTLPHANSMRTVGA